MMHKTKVKNPKKEGKHRLLLKYINNSKKENTKTNIVKETYQEIKNMI
jgi:hypothetical protein